MAAPMGFSRQVGVKPIRSYSDKMLAEEVKKAIIVVKGGITPFARSAIQELCAQREVWHGFSLRVSEFELTLSREYQFVPYCRSLGAPS